jgi:hypothetical protein
LIKRIVRKNIGHRITFPLIMLSNTLLKPLNLMKDYINFSL